jgi:hypothetical protein
MVCLRTMVPVVITGSPGFGDDHEQAHERVVVAAPSGTHKEDVYASSIVARFGELQQNVDLDLSPWSGQGCTPSLGRYTQSPCKIAGLGVLQPPGVSV